MTFIRLVKRLAHACGIEVSRYYPEGKVPADMSVDFAETYAKVRAYTMTSAERVFSLCEAVKYIAINKIEGDIVECGVWKGGSMMAVADTLIKHNDVQRHLYLFDTFEGMSEPTDKDVDIAGVSAGYLMEHSDKNKDESVWCNAPLDGVKDVLGSSGYPKDQVHFVKGMVETTIPEHAPQKIALLRLDTDWFESTRHELEHLFPRLVKGGVLIIDDYGHWQGARRAVDEYISRNNIALMLNRIDYTGRIAIKVE